MGDEYSFEIFSIYHCFFDVLELKTNQYCFLVSIATYHQKQQHFFHNFVMLEFPLIFEF